MQSLIVYWDFENYRVNSSTKPNLLDERLNYLSYSFVGAQNMAVFNSKFQYRAPRYSTSKIVDDFKSVKKETTK